MSGQDRSRPRVVTDPARRAFSAPSQTSRRKAKKSRTPDDILRDVRGLKLRQRVSLVLNDQSIRDELEEMIPQVPQNRFGGIRAYQDFLLPSGPGQTLPSGAVITPIADIRGSETLNYPRKERSLRCNLASVCRLLDLLGWSFSIYSHVTARLSSDAEEILINPYGLSNSEMTASCLLKTDFKGNIKDQGSTNLHFNKTSLDSHIAIYRARRDVKCAIYTRQPAVVAVSCMKTGILPISTEALLLGDVAYHELSGDESEKEGIARDIEGSAKVLILQNHGMICLGGSVEEAFYYTHLAVKACEYQVGAAGIGLDNLTQCREKHKDCVNEDNNNKTVKGKQEFEAWMRVLDNMGYKTGYVYENPDVFQGELQSDQESSNPFASRAYKNLYHYPDFEGQPVRRAHSTGRANTYRNRLKWLSTPVKSTEYRKERQQAELDDDYEPTVIEDLQSGEDSEHIENKASEEVFLESNTFLNESTPDAEEFLSTVETSTTIKSEYKTTYVVHTTSSHVESEHTDVRVLTVNGEKSEEQAKEQEESSSDENGESAEPSSPSKKRGSKVKKKASFKDSLVKKFSKK